MRKFFLAYILLLFCSAIPCHSQINTNRVLAIGRNALYFEDYVLSIQYFNQVIRSKPYLAEPYLFRAMAKFNLEDYKGAEDDITLCLERNSFLVYAYQCRGAARQNLGDYEGAIEDYSKGLEFRPEDKQMLINKAIAYIQLKDYDDAETTLNQLIRYQPRYMQAYLTRGAMFVEKGDTIKALNDFDTSIQMDKYYAPAYAQRAILYIQKEDYKSALKDYNEAIRLEPSQIGFYINRGLVRYHLNDFRGALSDYDAVITLDSRNKIARFNRGLLRAQVGDVNRAITDFDMVIQQEPNNFMAIYNRCLLNEEVGDYRKAITDLNRVLEEYPYFLPGYYFRSDLKKKMNDLKGADKDYWYAYDLEQKLKKEREQGKRITGKGTVAVAQDAGKDSDKTREESDKNIEKFNRLVVYDKDEVQKNKYKDELRGRVQDKNVKVDLLPQFVITFYEKIEVLNPRPHFDKIIYDYNNRMVLRQQLKVVNNEAALTDDQANFHFQSIDDYSLAIDRNPRNVDAYFGRAIDYMLIQDLSEAIEDYNKVIALDPNFVMAYFNRAVVRYKKIMIDDLSGSDNTNRSVDMSLNIQNGRSIKNVPNPPVAGFKAVAPAPIEDPQLNKESKRMYEHEMVMRDYDMVIKLNPDFIYAYFNKANMLCAQKDFRSAVNEYSEAILRNPEFAEAYFNRGLARLSQGDKPRGLEDLSKAGELGIIEAYSIIKKMTAD